MLRALFESALVACILSAQTPDTATIHGRIIDQSRAAISGVEIAARNSLTGLKRSTRSDDSGNFSLAGLPVAGAYHITASKPEFADANLTNVRLTGGAIVTPVTFVGNPAP